MPFCALWSDCLSHSSHGDPDFKKCTKLFVFHPSQAAWNYCNSSMHTRGHFCNTQLSSWQPQGSCSSPAGPEDMCHNLVKTCLSRLIQEHVASMGGSELWGENVTRFPDVQCETRKKWTGLSVTQACLSLSCQGSVFDRFNGTLHTIMLNRGCQSGPLIKVVTSGLLALQAMCALVKESPHLKSHSRFGFDVGFPLVDCDGVRQDDGLTHQPLSSAPSISPSRIIWHHPDLGSTVVEDHQWDPPSLKPTHLIFGHQTTQTLKWQQRKILSCARFNFLVFGHLLTSFHQQNLSRNVNLEMAFRDTPLTNLWPRW